MDTAGRLRVYPRLIGNKNYSFIWRDASSMRWDDVDRFLYVLPVDDFDAADELRQIVRAVKGEYGDYLFTDSSTEFAVPDDVVCRLREFAV
jgi:hypothetical protein